MATGNVQLWTDYPILESEYGKAAPIRKVWVKSYDEDKYCMVLVDGFGDTEYHIKRCYIYSDAVRAGDVGAAKHRVDHKKMIKLLNRSNGSDTKKKKVFDLDAVTSI